MRKQSIGIASAIGLFLIILSSSFLNVSATTPSLSWSSQSLTPTQSTIATIGLATDSNCVSTYSGTLTVTQPDGVNKASYSVTNEPCGTYVTSTYPSQFTGAAATTEFGVYTAVFSGTTANGGSFRLQDNLIVDPSCTAVTTTVTETVTVSSTLSDTQTSTVTPQIGSITVEVVEPTVWSTSSTVNSTFDFISSSNVNTLTPSTTSTTYNLGGYTAFEVYNENVPAGTTTVTLNVGPNTFTINDFPTTPGSFNTHFTQDGYNVYVSETEF